MPAIHEIRADFDANTILVYQAYVMPLGTVLGVFTFIVMMRTTVKALFQQQ